MPADEAPRGSRADHHGNLRGQLPKAIRGLVEEGPDGFSVAEAARAAGVSSGAPCRHFAGGDEIMRAVTLGATERLIPRLRTGAGRGPPGSLERLSGIGRGYLDFARAEPGVFRMMSGLTEGHGEDAQGVVADAVAAGMGLPREDPRVRARAYMPWSFAHGHAFPSIDGKSELRDLETDEAARLDHVGRGIVDAD